MVGGWWWALSRAGLDTHPLLNPASLSAIVSLAVCLAIARFPVGGLSRLPPAVAAVTATAQVLLATCLGILVVLIYGDLNFDQRFAAGIFLKTCIGPSLILAFAVGGVAAYLGQRGQDENRE